MNIEQEKMIIEALPSLYPLQDFEEKAIHKVIDALPLAQPEIIRCKDCVHADYKNIVKALWCSECGQGRTVAPNDFCSYAERREVTT